MTEEFWRQRFAELAANLENAQTPEQLQQVQAAAAAAAAAPVIQQQPQMPRRRPRQVGRKPKRRRDFSPPDGKVPVPKNPFVQGQEDPNDINECEDLNVDPDDDEMLYIYRKHWKNEIQTRFIVGEGGRVSKVHVRMDNPRVTLEQAIIQLHQTIWSSYKINIQFGSILQHIETGELRFFYDGHKTRLLHKDATIHNWTDINKLLSAVERMDLAEQATFERPNTKWTLRKVTNANILVYRMPQRIGRCSHLHMPKYVLRNKGMKHFITNPKGHQRLNDSLCFFRSLAEHNNILNETPHDPKHFESQVVTLMKQFCNQSNLATAATFDGMPLEWLDAAEKIFLHPIYVYELIPYVSQKRVRDKLAELKQERDGDEPDGEATDLEEMQVIQEEMAAEAIKKGKFCAVCLRKPQRDCVLNDEQQSKALYLNCFKSKRTGKEHFSYIHDIQQYSKCFSCVKCTRAFHKRQTLQRHEERCKGNQVHHLFPGNGAVVQPSLFDKLRLKFGFDIPRKLQFAKNYAAYDFECCFDNKAVDCLQPLHLGIHKCIPDAEDPQNPPDGLPNIVREHWNELHTRVGPGREYCVVRNPVSKDIPDYIKSMAKMQTRRFTMRVKLLTWHNNKLNSRIMPSSDVMANTTNMEAYLSKFTCDNIREVSMCRKILAVRIDVKPLKVDYTAELIPASVAVATNLPGFTDPATGLPKAHFLLSDGNTEQFVKRFVDVLDQMSKANYKLMRKQFRPIFKRINHQWLELHTRKMHRIVLEHLAERLESEENEELRKHHDRIERALEQISIRTVADKDWLRQTGQSLSMSAKRLDSLQKVFKLIRKDLSPKERREFYTARKAASDLRQVYKELEAHCSIFNVFGFNSAKFDVNLIRKHLLSELKTRQKQPLIRLSEQIPMSKFYRSWRTQPPRSMRLIKRGRAYLCISTSRLRFLDMSHFCAAGTSYDAWLKSRNVQCGAKYHFPYEWFDSLSKLDEDRLPPREAFYSTLKGKGISQEDYESIQEKWQSESWKNMRDLLEFYNGQDVVPFLEGIESMRTFFAEQGNIDMVAGNCISLPGLAERMLHANIARPVNFVLPQKTKRVDNSDVFTSVKEAIVGGPAIVFKRKAVAGVTRIRDPVHGKLCRKIVGYDANSLYLWASMQKMACQLPRRYDKQPDGSFKMSPFYRYHQSETEWLAWEEYCRQTRIYNRFNGGLELFGGNRYDGEKADADCSPVKDLRINGHSVDGYCPETKTCYFFDGCRWHLHKHFDNCYCNLAKRFIDTSNEKDVERAELIHRKDAAIRNDLRKAGYKIVVMQECNWLKYKSENPTAHQYLACEGVIGYRDPVQLPHGHTKLRRFRHDNFVLPHHAPFRSDEDLLKQVQNGKFFGIVEVDLELPPNRPDLEEKFSEFGTIFKNCNVGFDDIGEHMQAYVKQHKMEGKFPRRTLIASTHCKNTPMITPLLKWHLDAGFVCKVHRAFEYKGIACFKDFGEQVIAARRASDADPSQAPLGEMFKLLGNSLYGKSITAVELHQLITILDEARADQRTNDPFFKTAEELCDNWYEVCQEKETVHHRLNQLFGFFVYGYAKLRMIEFYHSFLDEFIPRDCFELMNMDTDSCYMAISSPDGIDSLVPEEKRDAYEAIRGHFLPARDGPQAALDKRKPGLFKLEMTGEAMICLAPKTYFVRAIAGSGAKDKYSCKGLPKSQNDLTYEAYQSVLDSGQSVAGRCSTFVYRRVGDDEEPKLYRCESERIGLSYLMIKRRVLDDGITTESLGL